MAAGSFRAMCKSLFFAKQMERKNGPWTIKSTQNPYKDKFIEVYADEVLKPDGEPSTYATVQMKPGVSVLPIDPDGQVYLVKQFRYAVGRETIETVSGGVEKGEPLLESVQREVSEELGIEAEEWIHLGVCDLDTSIINSQANLYICRGLSFSEPHRESTEQMQTLKMPLEEAVQKVMNSEITHGQSCVLILKAYVWMKDAKL